MRRRFDRRLVDPVQSALLSLRAFVSDFRCRSPFPAAVCRRVHRIEYRRIGRNACFCPASGGRSRLGLAPRTPRMEMTMSDVPPSAPAITEAERDELRRHGILLTSLEELYNWG